MKKAEQTEPSRGKKKTSRANRARKWVAKRALRRTGKRDPENAPTKPPTRGYA